MCDRFKHVELFAGCGGLSLGLAAAGFELEFANELSPMAAETFAYNILNENFKEKDFERKYTYYLDIDNQELNNLNKKLIIGDIKALNKKLQLEPKILNTIKGKIDLISGGPPCQSFSLIGKREKNNNRNQLPWAFLDLVTLIKPKVVLLENVSGILRAFKEDGQNYFAWFEIAKAFTLSDYYPICMHINAKYFGLPQSRPRFILLGLRKDLAKKHFNNPVLKGAIELKKRLLEQGDELKYEEVKDSFKYFELMKESDLAFFEGNPLLPFPSKERRTVHQAINNIKSYKEDIHCKVLIKDDYSIELDKIFPYNGEYIIKNLGRRKHSEKIKERFKLIKLFEKLNNGEKNNAYKALKKGTILTLKVETIKKLQEELSLRSDKDLDNYFYEHKSRKHSQRALRYDQPSPAALSIPDDICHYDNNEDRTLSIREMARIQSFPDWFEFRSKDTTGGKNRRFEVPNYTQVGNAVPPLLAYNLGILVKHILNNSSNGKSHSNNWGREKL